MEVRDLVRTPFDWVKVIAIVGAGLLVWLALSKLDDLTAWWPWSDESRLARTERERDRERSRADSLTEENEGRAAVERQDDAARVVVLETRTIVTQAQAEAQGAPDAEIPVGPERDARARAVRERLCLAHPGTCAGSPPEG